MATRRFAHGHKYVCAGSAKKPYRRPLLFTTIDDLGGTSYWGGGWEVEPRGDLTNGSASNVWARTLIERLMPIATRAN